MNYLKTILSKSVVLVAIIIFCASFTSFGQTEEKPNILIIMTDQQTWDAFGYAGNEAIITPNLDRLASEGLNFSHAVTPCPVCVPARTSILTGRLTETTGIRSNRDAKTGECYYPTFDEILVKQVYEGCKLASC